MTAAAMTSPSTSARGHSREETQRDHYNSDLAAPSAADRGIRVSCSSPETSPCHAIRISTAILRPFPSDPPTDHLNNSSIRWHRIALRRSPSTCCVGNSNSAESSLGLPLSAPLPKRIPSARHLGATAEGLHSPPAARLTYSSRRLASSPPLLLFLLPLHLHTSRFHHHEFHPPPAFRRPVSTLLSPSSL